MSQPIPERGWWARNWAWAVPVGCLTPLVVCGGGIALLIYMGYSLVIGPLKSSEVYTESVSLVHNHPAVQAALGTPMSEGTASGNLQLVNDAGTANLQIPLSGPKGSGTLRAVGTRSGGKWTLNSVVLDVNGSGEHIDVLAGK